MKKILMILQGEFPPDIRLEKEIKSLYENGFEVTIICNQYNKNRNENFKYCKTERIKGVFKNSSLNKIINFPIFFNPRFIAKSLKIFRKLKPDFIHAHDLPVAPIGLMLSKIFRKPLIYDMHENYPAALKAFKKKGIINFIFKNPFLAKILDKICIKYSDRIIVVVEENKERLIKTGVSPDKIIVVSNTVDINTFCLNKDDPFDVSKYKNKIILLYTGNVSPERGLDVPIYAMEKLKDEISNIQLLIVGNGKYNKILQKITNVRNLNNFISLLKWPGHENLHTYLKTAEICIIPQPSNEFMDTTIPHKLFEYMSFGKKILVSDAKPLKRIVEESKCGLVFESNSPSSFANKVIEILNDKSDFESNGINAVKNKYNWEVDSKKLINLYNNLI